MLSLSSAELKVRIAAYNCSLFPLFSAHSMATSLLASLFVASSSSSSATDPPPHSISAGVSQDETQLHNPAAFDHHAAMRDAVVSDKLSTSAPTTHVTSTKDVLSCPPSSSPPLAPSALQSSSIAPVRSPSTHMPSSSSSSENPQPCASSPATPALEPTSIASRPDSSSTPTVQRASRRRTMPARLSQVSSLLAGSKLEEELMLLETPCSPSISSSHHNTAQSESRHDAPVPSQPSQASHSLSHRFFTASSIVVLSSDASLLARAVYPTMPPSASHSHVKIESEHDQVDASVPASPSSANTAGFRRPSAPSSSSSLVSTLAIKRQQLIETPDFKPRDDTLYMPKTRGLRSETIEDTSDAAYERRHRKPEAAEKRQRKAEVDRLSRDRLKLLSRIEQLKSVEARLLQPIVVARDQVRAEVKAPTDVSPTKSLSQRTEDVRQELLEDAYDTLKRYDLLLSTTSDAKLALAPAPSTLATRPESAIAQHDASRSQSPRLKIRIKPRRASPQPKPTVASDESDPSRRVSSRQPKQRIESLPTPLTAAAVEAVEDGRRKRRRLSATNSASTVAHEHVPTRGSRRRASPEVRATLKRKSTLNEQPAQAPSSRRPQRAAAAAAAVASALQRQYAERSFSDLDYEDEEDEEDEEDDEDQEVESALNARLDASAKSPSHTAGSAVKTRDHRSHSASSTSSTSSVSSMASSLGYMYPTHADTGSLKVSQSLAEMQASDAEASSDSTLSATDLSPSANKRLKLVLSRSAALTGRGAEEAKSVLQEALSSDTEQSIEKRRALTESEAESILAAFLGTAMLAKKHAASAHGANDEHDASSSTTDMAVSSAASSAPPLHPSVQPTASKRRSTRRDTTQSFGEKLPDLLTKPAHFDFSIMRYLRSIDKPTHHH